MRILIAEDEPPLQWIAGKLMKQWGFEFDLAANGQEAVDQAIANQGKYDLCLMDINMPIMNGFEAARIIRRNLQYFPIMALTGNVRAKEEYLTVGMDDFLEKPYSIEKLYQKFTELSVKSYKVIIKGKDFSIKKRMPMNQQHAQELRQLAKDGLCKLNIRGIGAHDLMVVTHKNVPYKISHDFIENNEEVSIFLDRSKDKPAECHLYSKSTYPMPTVYLLEEEYEEKRTREDEILKDYTAVVTKKKEA